MWKLFQGVTLIVEQVGILPAVLRDLQVLRPGRHKVGNLAHHRQFHIARHLHIFTSTTVKQTRHQTGQHNIMTAVVLPGHELVLPWNPHKKHPQWNRLHTKHNRRQHQDYVSYVK